MSKLRTFKAALAALLLAWLNVPAVAHDFWFSADRIAGQPTARLRMWVGHQLGAEEERIHEAVRSRSLRLITPQGSRPLPAPARDGGLPFYSLPARLPQPALIAVDRPPVLFELEAAKFNHYLADEQLADIISLRGATAAPGRERYTRHLKLMLGAETAEPALSTRVLGQTLEIVLLAPAGTPGPERLLKARLLFEGQPLAGRTVRAFQSADGGFERETGQVQEQVTDTNGAVVFRHDLPGFWLLRAVHARPCTGCSGADWESFWAAYSLQTDWLPAPAGR